MDMHLREHRGGLAEAMETAVVVDGIPGLVTHLQKQFADVGFADLTRDQITVEPYGGDDSRIGWKNVHIVCTDRRSSRNQPPWGPLGFCAMLDGSPPS